MGTRKPAKTGNYIYEYAKNWGACKSVMKIRILSFALVRPRWIRKALSRFLDYIKLESIKKRSNL